VWIELFTLLGYQGYEEEMPLYITNNMIWVSAQVKILLPMQPQWLVILSTKIFCEPEMAGISR